MYSERCSSGKSSRFPLQQEPGFAQLPRTQRVAPQHAQAKAELAVAAQARFPLRAERGLPLGRIEGHEEVHRAIEDREDPRIVARVVAVDELEVFDGGAQRRIIVVVHPQRRVRAHLERGLGDYAELAIPEDHPFEEFRILRVRAFDDLAGRRDHLQSKGLVGAAAEARRVDVDAAHAQRSADRRGQVERRRQVVQVFAAQFLGQAVPEDPGLGAHRQRFAIDVQNAAHAGHVEQHATEGDRLAFGGQSAAAYGDRHAKALRQFHQAGDLPGAAREHDAVRHPVSRAPGIGRVGTARRHRIGKFDSRLRARHRRIHPRPRRASARDWSAGA